MDPLDHLVRGVAATIGEGPDPRRRARQRRRVAGLRAGGASDRRGLWFVAVATACVLALAWIVREPPVPALAGVAGPSTMAGAWLVAREQPVPVEFADRSRVVLAPGAAARVVGFGPAQAELNLERGQIEVAIVADAARAWRISAGPFTVAVTGTQLTVDWQPETTTLTVAVAAGHVQVHGGGLPGAGTQLSAGQRLVTRPADPGLSAQVGEAASVGASPGETPANPGRVRVATPVAPAAPGWRELADRGDHAAAIAAVERAGFVALLDRLDAADLERLAHSARLARAAGPARESLEALRRRFPGDPRAETATFLLGRVALELANDRTGAAQWFGEYVRTYPRGPLVAEARARRMLLLHELGDVAEARAAAGDYLQHHPDGGRASLARSILGIP